MRRHERWIWTELIAFDVTQPDQGVSEYLDAAGFTPDVICLLLSSPDFVLSHEDREEEFDLGADFCSREGHEFNRQRPRQVWTNRKLQALIRNLQSRGIGVFLTVFTSYTRDRFHHEWVSDHLEVCTVYRELGHANAINALSRLNDGSFFEDFFFSQLARVMEYYGFDGWHGADGWGPLSGPIWRVSISDDMVEQFVAASGVSLAAEVGGPCGLEVAKLDARLHWIWRNHRHEWITFWADRWAQFWRKGCERLHAIGKRAVINSSWGRAPWESLYRYGIDYRKIVDAGVDGIIVETAAAGLALRKEFANERQHYDFLSMLTLIRAYVPEARLIFLHNVHDVCEEWDALRHIPALLERDLYSLANQYLQTSAGLRPAADGFLACLGDGLLRREWQWLRERWQQSFGEPPRRIIGATLLWSDALMHAEVPDFTAHRTMHLHRLLFELMALGAPVQSAVRVEDLQSATGPLLALSAHLLPREERERVLAHAEPVVVIGRSLDDWPSADFTLRDTAGTEPLELRLYGGVIELERIHDHEVTEDALPEDLLSFLDQDYYWYHLRQQPVTRGFLKTAAQVLQFLARAPRPLSDEDELTVMAQEQSEAVIRVALKSKRQWYVRPEVEMGEPIAEVNVVTEFPLVRVRPDGSRFAVRIPPQGIVVVDVKTAGS